MDEPQSGKPCMLQRNGSRQRLDAGQRVPRASFCPSHAPAANAPEAISVHLSDCSLFASFMLLVENGDLPRHKHQHKQPWNTKGQDRRFLRGHLLNVNFYFPSCDTSLNSQKVHTYRCCVTVKFAEKASNSAKCARLWSSGYHFTSVNFTLVV